MDATLKDLGQTLAVGIFALVGLVYIGIQYPSSWKERMLQILTGAHKLYQAGLILALVFAAGVLVEDLSKNYTAERIDNPILEIPSSVFYFLVDTDKELRLRSFVSVHSSAKDYIEFSPSSVYRSLMSIRHRDERFIRNTNTLSVIKSSACTSELENKTCRRIDGEDLVKEQANVINQLYYDAKNRVYRESTYFSELQEIEKRLNFARSLTFLCLVYSLLVLPLVVIAFASEKKNSSRKNFQSKENRKGGFISALANKRYVVLLMFCVYVSGMLLARISFRSETINYNLRVFGYYVSLAAQSNIPKDDQQESLEPHPGVIRIR